MDPSFSEFANKELQLNSDIGAWSDNWLRRYFTLFIQNKEIIDMVELNFHSVAIN